VPNAGMKCLLTVVLFFLGAGAVVQAAPPIPDEYKTGGFAIGCQAYSFNRYSVFEAIEKTAETGGKVIEFYPGQKLKKDSDAKFSHDSPPEVIKEVKAKLQEHHLLAVAYGVVGIPEDEQAARKVFDFAKTMGLRVLNTESDKSIDTIEKLVKEYDIKVGYHDHPKRPNDEKYRMWDPNYILSLVKDRDPRIGSCADTGHWVRSGLKPVDCLRILKGRIVSSHLKDLHEFSRDGHDVPYGQGKSDVPGILAEFKAQNFEGPISVEYEHNWESSVPEIKQCIDFVRTFGARK
jgi:sugar phosphate isomerase/epimerase